MEYSDSDEKVGYRRPPKRSQFKNGHSGNPRGWAKGASVRLSVQKLIAQTVPVKVDGVRRRVPVTEAMTMQLAQSALAGDPAARRDFLKMADQVAQAEREDEARKPLTIVIRDVVDTYRCCDTLVTLGGVAKDKQAHQFGIEPWVIQAAQAHGVVLTDEQRDDC